jgi:predicted AAA+ superfamily ATPase
LQQDISQTLAGRIAYVTLLPLSINEMIEGNILREDINDILWRGNYPAIYSVKPKPSDWYANYIRTYVERDVRQIRNIENLTSFSKFMRICATNIGQLLNLSSIGNELGIDQKTIKAWLSILESSYVIYLLQPYFTNQRKRLVKTPKLYFYDTGLASFLLGLNGKKDIANYYGRGSLFENFIITEFLKENFNQGLYNQFYFWRDKTGNEIDLIIEKGVQKTLIEIKASQTYNASMLKAVEYYKNNVAEKNKAVLIYTGDMNYTLKNNTSIRNWKYIKEI